MSEGTESRRADDVDVGLLAPILQRHSQSTGALLGILREAAVGAPTSLALDLARELNMLLVCFVRDGRMTVYAPQDDWRKWLTEGYREAPSAWPRSGTRTASPRCSTYSRPRPP